MLLADESSKTAIKQPQSRNVGRPTKLTPERHKTIVDLVRKGATVEAASGVVGITPESFFGWMRRGQAESENPNSEFFQFFRDISRARDELEAELALKWKKLITDGQSKVRREYKEQAVCKPDGTIEIVRVLDREVIEHVDGDWRGIAEFMLRRYPNWTRKEGVELTGANGGPVQVENSVTFDDLPLEGKRELLQVLEKWNSVMASENAKNVTPEE